MRILSFVAMAVLQLALLPLAIPAYMIAAYKQVFVSKRLGVSGTGIEIANGRWMMHWFGLREDEAAGPLLAALPNCSFHSMRLILFPLWLHYKISGHRLFPRVPPEGRETIGDLVAVRTVHIDRMIRERLDEVRQIVLLGAGYDTRALGLLREGPVEVFELDRPKTQRLKVAALREAGLEADNVRFIEVDFGREDPWGRLRSAGFDPSAPTLFLWEGVTLYLSEEDVRAVLREVRSHAPTGSSLVADFYGEPMAKAVESPMRAKALEFTGESFDFILPLEPDPESAIRAFVGDHGLTVAEVRSLGTLRKDGAYSAVAHLRW
jgi:methyltransferase (TIGR00027 family)